MSNAFISYPSDNASSSTTEKALIHCKTTTSRRIFFAVQRHFNADTVKMQKNKSV
jgi:hypothetical protein